MAKQPYISHTVNGYSRYDVPESKAFTCTPGILYPVRIDFINARDRVRISQGIDVRSNPLAVPTFNPYTVRLHRFWVPLQLYHPEMRTNSSEFDMNNLSLNFLRTYVNHAKSGFNKGEAFSNSLTAWLRISQRNPITNVTSASAELASDGLAGTAWVTADSYLAYWDIVRNYYSFSQYPLYSYAWPMAWVVQYAGSPGVYNMQPAASERYFTQCYGDLSYLDYYYESQFYPGSSHSSNGTYNRMGILYQIINSFTDITSPPAKTDIQYTVSSTPLTIDGQTGKQPSGQTGVSFVSGAITMVDIFNTAHPMAVVPSSPDRLSRMLPATASGDSVSVSSTFTVPQLAIASRLQEYKDLLGAGGSRYSDWLETFFASRIDHVDRPKLLFSASQTVNAQIIMATAGKGISTDALGTQGGAIAFNSMLGRSQSYFFREPGYMIDMLSIRPVYYWQNVKPDYLRYQGADYFNPLYNDIGYQDVPLSKFSNLPGGASSTALDTSIYREPCFNEFRASYDEALGDFGSLSGYASVLGKWVQSRSIISIATSNIRYAFSDIPTLFVDLSTVNDPFSSAIQDNFFVNLSYSVQKKNLVNKSFATRLANR
ncbi:major capsid protein [Alistipes putredinis]|uniref:major capsid protein n=1 Tax=Alistipes putredinis TaxID=28117 RepID=UPI003AB7DACF